MEMTADEIRKRLGQEITNALKLLLSEKHLYQSVSVDCGFFDEEAAAGHEAAMLQAAEPSLGRGGSASEVPSLDKFKAGMRVFLKGGWLLTDVELIQTGRNNIRPDRNPQTFALPTIKTTCNYCNERGPFNPVDAVLSTGTVSPEDQWLSLSYKCQNCKIEAIRFLVRRTGIKLTLSGRDPFETFEIPSFIPKDHSTNFRNALIASHGGQTLAAIFLLRVFVEQFWRSVPEVCAAVKDKPRPTGEELGDAYKKTLPASFKEEGFPTLAEVYDSLSEAMHSARADATVFEDCHQKIVLHFDARRLFNIVTNGRKQAALSKQSVKGRNKSARRKGKPKSQPKRVGASTPPRLPT